MTDQSFDLRFENSLIKDQAVEAFDDCISLADRRNLEADYVIERFLKEFTSKARREGLMK